MATSKDFADYCCELLSGVGPTTAKRMFGGWGIYVDEVTIAIITDLTASGSGKNGKLYLKADDSCKAQFEAASGWRLTLRWKQNLRLNPKPIPKPIRKLNPSLLLSPALKRPNNYQTVFLLN